MTHFTHPRRMAHCDFQDPCRSERVIRLANHATTDPEFTTDLYFRGNSISRLEVVVLDVLDQVSRHSFREVVVSDGDFHEPSLP